MHKERGHGEDTGERMPCEEGGGNCGDASTVLASYDDTTINAG